MNGHDKGKQITIKCKRKNFRCDDGEGALKERKEKIQTISIYIK
jgi:hypothetical protein